MSSSKSPESSSGVAGTIDEIGQTVHDYTKRNMQTVNYWLRTKRDQLGSTEHIGLAVVVNVAMVAVGLAAVAAPWGVTADAAGVAWAVLNGYPLAQAVWGWLLP